MNKEVLLSKQKIAQAFKLFDQVRKYFQVIQLTIRVRMEMALSQSRSWQTSSVVLNLMMRNGERLFRKWILIMMDRFEIFIPFFLYTWPMLFRYHKMSLLLYWRKMSLTSSLLIQRASLFRSVTKLSNSQLSASSIKMCDWIVSLFSLIFPLLILLNRMKEIRRYDLQRLWALKMLREREGKKKHYD